MSEVMQMNHRHQPGQASFRSILPEDIQWKQFSAFPASAPLAVLVGDPTHEGPYLVRVKVPSGVKLMPHKHPEDRIYTVMSGVFYIGLGDEFDGDKMKAYPPGSVIVLPGDTPHFHWAKSGEYVTQVTAGLFGSERGRLVTAAEGRGIIGGRAALTGSTPMLEPPWCRSPTCSPPWTGSPTRAGARGGATRWPTCCCSRCWPSSRAPPPTAASWCSSPCIASA